CGVTRGALPLWSVPGAEPQPSRAAMTEKLVRTVGVAVTGHAVPLHDALIALALGGADNVDDVARLEHLAGAEDLADLELLQVLRLPANLAQDAGGVSEAGLLHVA